MQQAAQLNTTLQYIDDSRRHTHTMNTEHNTIQFHESFMRKINCNCNRNRFSSLNVISPFSVSFEYVSASSNFFSIYMYILAPECYPEISEMSDTLFLSFIPNAFYTNTNIYRIVELIFAVDFC